MAETINTSPLLRLNSFASQPLVSPNHCATADGNVMVVAADMVVVGEWWLDVVYDEGNVGDWCGRCLEIGVG